MSKNKRVTSNSVQYYFLIKDWENIYKLWKTKIDRLNWDIYFFPSFESYLILNDWDEKQTRKVNYLSFHKSWEFHFKVEEWVWEHRLSKMTTIITEMWKWIDYGNLDNSDVFRTRISNIKYQRMLNIFIKDFSLLEKFQKSIDNIDVVFENITEKAIEFSFSIISWKLIIWFHKWILPKWINMESKECFKVHNRALWYESWNWDKMLQYSLSKLSDNNFSWNVLLRVFNDSIINNMII